MTKVPRFPKESASSAAIQAFAPLIAFLPLVLLRFGGLTHQSLWFDEGYTLTLCSVTSLRHFVSLFSTFTLSEHLQPLYYFMMFGWTRVAGTSDTALRLPSAICSSLSGLCLYRLVVLLTNGHQRWMAALAVAAYSMLSFSVYYGQEARPYALIQLTAFTVVTAWVAAKEQRHTQPGIRSMAIILLAVAASAATLSGAFNILLVVTLATVDLLTTRQRSDWMKLWRIPLASSVLLIAAYGAFALRYLPHAISSDVVSIKQPLWMNLVYLPYGVFFGTTLGPPAERLRGLHKLHAAISYWPILTLALIAAFALVASVIWIARQRSSQQPYASVLLLVAATYAVPFVLIFGVVGKLNVLPRHASSLFALACCILACILVQLPALWKSAPRATGVFLGSFLLCLLLNAVSLYHYYTDAAFRKDDYRAIARHLPQDSVPTFLPAGDATLMQHYGAHLQAADEIEPDRLASYLLSTSGASPVIRVVMNEHRNHLWDFGPTLAIALAPLYRCANEMHEASIDVSICTLKSSPLLAEPRSLHAR
jgi:4-amino-4-deoxy-L-arabinose transferase-like glycosyltransferase